MEDLFNMGKALGLILNATKPNHQPSTISIYPQTSGVRTVPITLYQCGIDT